MHSALALPNYELNTGQYTVDIKGILNDNISDEYFFNFCQDNRDARIERDHNRGIFIKSPAVFYIGVINATISGDLHFWNRQLKSGTAFGSSAGFTLKDGAFFSPDAARLATKKQPCFLKKIKKSLPMFAPILLSN